MAERTVPADHFAKNLAANVDNEKLSDKDFREFVRNTLSVVIFDDPREQDQKSQ